MASRQRERALGALVRLGQAAYRVDVCAALTDDQLLAIAQAELERWPEDFRIDRPFVEIIKGEWVEPQPPCEATRRAYGPLRRGDTESVWHRERCRLPQGHDGEHEAKRG